MWLEDRDEARRKIDEEVAGLLKRIRVLYASRNALASVNSLPPEILSRIFRFVRTSYQEWMELHKINLKWLPITQVSQHWRQVAIEDASLWTQLPYHNIILLRLFLARSRMCPISVSLRLPTPIPPSCTLALQSISRIQHLRLFTSAENWNRIVAGLCVPALELKELKITNLLEPTRRSSGYPALSWPQNLLGANAPLLRQLTLAGIPFVGYRPAFHHLTHFVLDEPPIRTPIAVLLDALSQMPNLIGLTLRDSVFNQNQEILENDMDISNLALPIVMRHLEQVIIEAPSLRKSLLLFSSLQFLTSPALSFRCLLLESDTIHNSFPRLLQELNATYQNGITPFSAMRLGADIMEFKLNAQSSPTHKFCLSLFSRDHNVDLRHHFVNWFGECKNLPLDLLESVDLYGTKDLNLFQHFAKLAHLKSLSGESRTGTRSIEYILQNFEQHFDEMRKNPDEGDDWMKLPEDPCQHWDIWEDIAFPALEVLKLQASHYDGHNHRYLVNTLNARKHHGYVLKKIILDDCSGVTSRMVEELEGVGIEVDLATSNQSSHR